MSAAPSSSARRVRLPSRPVTRGDCAAGGRFAARPCPFADCRHHLASPIESCALDVAGRGGATLEEVSKVFGVTRERIRQIERDACVKLRARLKALA